MLSRCILIERYLNSCKIVFHRKHNSAPKSYLSLRLDWTEPLPLYSACICITMPTPLILLNGVVRLNFNFNPHIILSQSSNADTSPQRLVVRHPLAEVAHHCFQSFVVKRNMIGIHSENLCITSIPC